MFLPKIYTYIIRRLDDIFFRYFVTFINAPCWWVVGLTVFFAITDFIVKEREGGEREREWSVKTRSNTVMYEAVLRNDNRISLINHM